MKYFHIIQQDDQFLFSCISIFIFAILSVELTILQNNAFEYILMINNSFVKKLEIFDETYR